MILDKIIKARIGCASKCWSNIKEDYMKILNFGSLNIDKVYTVDSFVQPGETKSATNVEIFEGGKGLNQSVSIARAGAYVCHAGKIGEDGLFLKTVLGNDGVNTDLIEMADTSSGQAIIQVSKSGENCILLYSGANYCMDKQYIDRVLQTIGKNDMLILQNEINALEYIIDEAYKKEIKIILNPSPINGTRFDLDKISWLVLNEIEGQQLTNKEDKEEIITELINSYPDIKVVLTLGEEGAIFAEKDIRIKQKRYDVEAVDTTAAGDTFTGYFFANIAKGVDVKECLELASKAAAICVTRKGAAPAIPYEDQVKRFI